MMQSASVIQGMFMMQIIPVVERLIKDDMPTCVLLMLVYLIFTNLNEIYTIYKKLVSKNKIGRTYTLDIYSNKQTCKSIGSREIKAILYDFYANKDVYNITHFTALSCSNNKSSDDWLSLSSIDYSNIIHIYSLLEICKMPCIFLTLTFSFSIEISSEDIVATSFV